MNDSMLGIGRIVIDPSSSSLPPSNQLIQFPDQFPLTLAAFFTGLQMIEKSRQVQPTAQLNTQMIEVFAAGQIERDLL